MAKAYGILAAQATGFASLGTLRNIKYSRPATVNQSRGTDGTPDGEVGVVDPVTITAQYEINGTVPDPLDEVTVGSDTFILTEVGDAYEVGQVNYCDVSAVKKYGS